MKDRRYRRLLAAVTGVAAVVALGVAALMVAAAAARPTNNAPSIEIQGNTYANTTGVTGQVVQQIQFSMGARSGGKTPTSGWFEDQFYNVIQDGTFSQVSYNNVKVDCLSADKSTGSVWFSGVVTAGNDLRLPAEMQQQEQSIIAAGNMILYGRLRDSNGDGSADQRSLFVTQATTAYPNALLSSADNGTIATPWFINGNATSAATACLLHDSAFNTADYDVVDGPSNQVQWLEPDDTTTVGGPITGTATNLMNPPAQSVYSIASINRTLLSPTLYMTLR
jgi:hypothetical protein